MSMANLIDPNEWNFSACPNDRLEECKSYEFARLVPSLVRLYPDKLERYEIDQYYHLMPNGRYAWLPPGFPIVPFLKLKPKYQIFDQAFSKALAAKYGGNHPSIYEAKNDLDRNHKARYELCINWMCSDKKIKNDFAKLLKNIRPFKAKEKRGNRYYEQLRADLTALSAFKVLNVMSDVDEATSFCKKHRASLYEDKISWWKAVRRVATIFKDGYDYKIELKFKRGGKR